MGNFYSYTFLICLNFQLCIFMKVIVFL
jgi:hypothetical protein